jgi:hypothetical protein
MRGRVLVLGLHARRVSAGLVLALSACGGGEPSSEFGPYASKLVDFSPGPGAGFGQDNLPDIVLGPPAGTFDVVSLGTGGSITVGFEFAIVDGPGPDFVVFENAFVISGTVETFAEPGRVEVSADGERFESYPCDTGAFPFVGCAGVQPTGDADLFSLAPDTAGGDAFDLADLELTEARFVRIVDTSTSGEGTTAGFDLDAVGAFNRSDDSPGN